jgi:alpha-D-glucose phosphate-specific phosphoglucomutase
VIKFGTSGWRGIIAKEFTYDRVIVVAQAIANILKKESKEASVIIGYDRRFMSEDFARTAAEIFAGNDIKVLLCKRDVPTPMVVYNIINLKLTGGVNFTASHNSYIYNGLKYFHSSGGLALSETTRKIEKYCSFVKYRNIKTVPFEFGIRNNIIKIYNPYKVYVKKIKELVDFKILKKSNVKVVVDVLHGTASGYLDALLDDAGIHHITINKNRDIMFNGKAPDPSKENLSELMNIMKKESYMLGLSTDGDADRFGVIDTDGTFITPNQVISVLLYYLNKTRNWKGIVVKSIMTTGLLDKIAAKIGVDVVETPIGFKHIGNIMLNNQSNFILGGEESGGLTIRGHIPEKDGILACLLIIEAITLSKKSFKDILKDIKKFTGEVFSSKLNLHLSPDVIKEFKKKLNIGMINNTISGMKIQKDITIDGHKFILDDNTWIGFRFSVTEPVIRVYAEAVSQVKLNKLLNIGKAFIYGK